MSRDTRKELLETLRCKYKEVDGQEKTKLLDTFVEATGYSRKHAIALFNETKTIRLSVKRINPRIYDEELKIALITLWNASNNLCSKRLVPFIPELIRVLEKQGNLQLTKTIRQKLTRISPATVDRLLASQRQQHSSNHSTKPGSLLKKQIPVRTFTQWDDAKPGFFEADLVSHSGSDPSGQFLQTLTLTDISTQWTECIALLRKGELEVRTALQDLEPILPFPLLGLDTDNGFEFINYNLLKWCQDRSITFTRSRPYKKNDQAHVEEKNGSVVRKFIGCDRLEGKLARQKLSHLYSLLRLYTNFFQPSQKLIEKHRIKGKLYRKHDKAKTPFQRVLESISVSNSNKRKLRKQYQTLDPILLLEQIKNLQVELDKLSIIALYPKQKMLARKRMKASLQTSQLLPPANGKSLREIILSLPPGATFQAIDLLAYSSRHSVDVLLYRLNKCGLIARIGWGVYRILHTQDNNILHISGTKFNEATSLKGWWSI